MNTLREALWALKEALPHKALWAEHNCTTLPGGEIRINFPVRMAGICMNVEQYLRVNKVGTLSRREVMHGLDNLIMIYCDNVQDAGLWPYPVGGSEEFMQELETGSIWENPKRIELLDWLLEYCHEAD